MLTERWCKHVSPIFILLSQEELESTKILNFFVSLAGTAATERYCQHHKEKACIQHRDPYFVFIQYWLGRMSIVHCVLWHPRCPYCRNGTAVTKGVRIFRWGTSISVAGDGFTCWGWFCLLTRSDGAWKVTRSMTEGGTMGQRARERGNT